MIRVRNFAASLAIAGALAIGVLGVSPPARAGGFCCRPSLVIRLLPTAEGMAAGLVSGTAEIDECVGLSFLHIVAFGRVANGTQLIPVLPGYQPVIGDWFTISRGRGETVMSEITSVQVSGAVLDVTDENFTPLLTGTF